MPVIAADYSCHHCGCLLVEQDIARVHFLKKCPVCSEAMVLNATGALTRTRGATAAGLVGMVIAMGACVVALTVLGINENTLEAWPSEWQVALALAVASAGTLVAYVFQRIQVNAVLGRTRKQLQDDGLL